MKKGNCIHFNGVMNDFCKAGMPYDSVRDEKPDPNTKGRIPCITFNGRRSDTCPKFLEPTDEQIAQFEKETEESVARITKVMQVVSKWKTWTKTNRIAKQEVIECPICKGKLHSQAAYNGHVWGGCETEGCVSWMQ